ncbi:S41 family peptidase [Ferruginibacter lapsinanis]|uniref:S41 family peptidase n=1 Tax=Ferruginibacter lapsinanis TaxID=563172 RepID=UPI001E337113|nr:S41 family peptidase [Ferruginibacter lapsinanis]UEG48773.1 S41 family peptidase [Ferruginibacter lapsinanis]
MNKKIQVWLPLLFSLTMIVGMIFGYQMRDNMPGKRFFSLDKSTPLQEVMDLIKSRYVDDVKVNALGDTAIMAMLSKLDPHSVFIPKEELQGVNEDLAGKFFGIGIEFNIFDDTINVINVLPDGPSFIAGLQAGDKFIKVDDSLVAGQKITSERVRKLLRGDMGTKVVITVLRNNTKKVFTVNRDAIPIVSIDAGYMLGGGIGYIKINKFSQSTYREFMQTLEKLQAQGLKELVLDLRGNPGGILDEATEIADEFLDGDKLITYTEGKNFPKKEYRCKRQGLFEKGSLVVLMDEGSASASEVLSGALQDWDRATIIGRRSFGKGLVQEQYDLSDGSALRLTVARYYTPIGRSIQRSYTNGGKAYYDEISNRFHDGEVFSADSVKNDTSKLYKTMGGKKVYGGGGITPDFFIPIDTGNYSLSATKIYLSGTIGDFAYKYYLQNLQQLSAYKTPAQFVKGFSFSEADWNAFGALAAKDSINLNAIPAKEKSEMQLRLKASIARQIWRSEGFYEVYNTEDNALKKAVEELLK